MQSTCIYKNDLQPRMNSIEAARGIAAMIVLLMHAGSLMAVDHFSGHVGLGGTFAFGYVGVDFFFTLSGFIIAFIHFDDIGRPSKLISYLKKRLIRIFPIYWFCLALAAGILVAGRLFLGKDTPLDFFSKDIAGTIFLLPMSPPKFLEVAWSLQYELMFYAAFALLIAHRKIGFTVFLIWILTIVWHLALDPNALSGYGFLSANSLQFLFGVAVGIISRTKDFPKIGKPFLALGICCFAGSILYERMVASELHGPAGKIFLGLSAALILLSLSELEKRRQLQTPTFMHRLGAVSYSIYLSHWVSPDKADTFDRYDTTIGGVKCSKEDDLQTNSRSRQSSWQASLDPARQPLPGT